MRKVKAFTNSHKFLPFVNTQLVFKTLSIIIVQLKNLNQISYSAP